MPTLFLPSPPQKKRREALPTMFCVVLCNTMYHVLLNAMQYHVYHVLFSGMQYHVPCPVFYYPTTNGGTQNGSSVGTYTRRCLHIFRTFGTDLHAQSVLINKISASELRRKFIKGPLLVGYAIPGTMCTTCKQFLYSLLVRNRIGQVIFFPFSLFLLLTPFPLCLSMSSHERHGGGKEEGPPSTHTRTREKNERKKVRMGKSVDRVLTPIFSHSPTRINQ